MVKNPKNPEAAQLHFDQAAQQGIDIDAEVLDLFIRMNCLDAAVSYFVHRAKAKNDSVPETELFFTLIKTAMAKEGQTVLSSAGQIQEDSSTVVLFRLQMLSLFFGFVIMMKFLYRKRNA